MGFSPLLGIPLRGICNSVDKMEGIYNPLKGSRITNPFYLWSDIANVEQQAIKNIWAVPTVLHRKSLSLNPGMNPMATKWAVPMALGQGQISDLWV